ncbi:DEAD/DEAH box helicase family protein [bacterium]|nr:DEAD/DEAH box helicase family protein [bacterium]MBU1956994.1 DEAD/DEAH box helicase family protein [bacterium]
MSNFAFLVHEFETLKTNSVKSESYAVTDPLVSAICSRKALETSVKFMYKIDKELETKFAKKNELALLIQQRDFLEILPSELLDELHFIRKLGNQAAHTNDTISSKNSMYANQCLYKFQRWMVEVYSAYEVEENYDMTKMLPVKATETKEEILAKSKEQEELEEQNAVLQAQIEALKAQIPNKKVAPVQVEGLSEKETRQKLIDLELKEAGYAIEKFQQGWDIEYKVTLDDGSDGYADYVIWSDDGKPLAVIEAKKASVSVSAGRHQARRYTEALKEMNKCDVLTFVTNGRVIEYSDGDSAFREIHSIFPKEELQRALRKKVAMRRALPSSFEVDNSITDRGYQKLVIVSVLKHFESGQRRAILVMATGTGKTRVSASLSDVLIRAGWVRKVLFLADRKELVKQACNNYREYLDETTVNLVLEKKDLNARMHFGTYETVHNLIERGAYNSAYFDLIVVDEAHRTIYKKYRAIFEYFDAFVLGLTATPADEVHRNTYNFFNASEGEPTDAYGLRRAIDDGNLVDFEPYEIDLGIVKRGIKYAALSDDEKEHYEETFDEEEEEISSSEINQRVLNKETNDKVLQYLHQHGFKIEEGNKIGKSIIFAKNKGHAEYIKERFDLLYPSRAKEAEIIHSGISQVDDLLDNFKNPKENPQIAISVDMLDTGIDVPELLNLVFFKPVKSKIKFWQMIGRGTRLSPNLFGEGRDKEKFKIFDFCANFNYFDMNAEGLPSQRTISLKERLFLKRVKMLTTMPKGRTKEAIKNVVASQLGALDASAYTLKKHRHLVEELRAVNLEYISDEVLAKLKTISEYIEDETHVEKQRFEMLTLNAQEALVKGEESQKYVDEIKERCFVLKSKAQNIKAIQEQEVKIDAVLEGNNELNSIESLEVLKNEIAHLANLSLGRSVTPVKSDFRDKVEDIRILKSEDFIKKAEVETEVQKVFAEYIERLLALDELKNAQLISDKEINEIKHQVFDYEKMVEDRLENRDEFALLMKEVMNSSTKQIANKIFDNYIQKGTHTQKQIELSNEIKNILFGKKYATLEASLNGVKDELFSEIHPLANVFERLSDEEQMMIINLITLLGSVEQQLK